MSDVPQSSGGLDGEKADLAGEYVLGTLSADEAAAVAERMRREHALAAEVYRWQDRLLPLTARIAAQVPSPSLWHRIEQATGMARQAARAPTRSVPPWWQRLGLWQGLSAGALAASLVLAVLLVQRVAEPPAARYLAVLQSPEQRNTGWIVEMQARGRLRLVPVAPGAAVPEDRALQFWTKPQGAAGPTSLGLVRAGQVVDLPVSRLPAVEADQLFEITLEPRGGSPIDRPTGPILFVGRTVRL